MNTIRLQQSQANAESNGIVAYRIVEIRIPTRVLFRVRNMSLPITRKVETFIRHYLYSNEGTFRNRFSRRRLRGLYDTATDNKTTMAPTRSRKKMRRREIR